MLCRDDLIMSAMTLIMNKSLSSLRHSSLTSLTLPWQKKITLSSKTDPVVLTTLQALDGEMPLPFKSKLTDWTYKGGILSYKDRVYVPDHLELCHAAVAKHHDHPTAGHPSILKTCQLVTTEFWWPGLPIFI